MTIEMRELRGDDLYTLLGIVGKLDVKDDFVGLFEKNISETDNIVPMDFKDKEPTKAQQKKIDEAKAKEDAEATKRGMEMAANLMQKVLLNIKTIKVEINELLSDLTGLSVQEVKELGLKDYTSLVVRFFKKPELRDFFESIASLLN